MNLGRFNEIVNGWKNYIFPNERIEALAKERAEICSNCPLNTNNTCDSNKVGAVESDFMYKAKDEFRQKGELHFGCGCPLSAKTRSEITQCPLNKW